jgi:hypothetical protein
VFDDGFGYYYFRKSTGVFHQDVQAHSTTTLSADTTSTAYGQPVRLTATVNNLDSSNAPAGTVVFYDGAKSIGTAVVAAGGQAVLVTTALTTGPGQSITALYKGSIYVGPSTSAAASVSVVPAATSVSVSSSASGPVTFGTPVTLTATVANLSSGLVPTGGPVSFYLDYTPGQPLPKPLGTASLVKGVARFTAKAIPGGPHTVTAIYAGTANYQGATSDAVSQAVSPANTTAVLTGPASPMTFGALSAFTVAVTNTDTAAVPAGQVQFWDGSVLLTTVNLNVQGKATLSRKLARGSHAITAVYLGTAGFNGSTSNEVDVTVS